MVNAPARSKPPVAGRDGAVSLMRGTAATRISADSSTGAKNTQRQPIEASSPPATRPSENPPAAVPAYTPSALVRCGPSGKLPVTSASPAGAMNAAATPVTNRATSSIQPSVAKPPRPEKTRKTVSQNRNIRRRPSRSAARPPSSMKPP